MALGADKTEFSKFTKFFGETKLPDSVVVVENGVKKEALLAAGKSGVTGSEDATRPLVLPPGGGTPGVAPHVPSGGAPPARVHSFCPATTAPGGEGVVALVRALECNSVREGRGDVPNATGNGGTVARATDDWGSPGKRMGGTKGVELARAENGKEAVVDGGKMAERAAVVGEKRQAVVEASGEEKPAAVAA